MILLESDLARGAVGAVWYQSARTIDWCVAELALVCLRVRGVIWPERHRDYLSDTPPGGHGDDARTRDG